MTAFIQAAHTSSGSNLPPTRIVIHGTVSPCQPGNARSVAAYFQSASSGGSAHYVVDPGEIVQCVADDVVAWHSPPNRYSLGVELSDPQTGDPNRWADANHDSMLRLAAGLVRDLAAKYGIPVVKLSPADLLAGKSGICGHVDVSNAWHQTDHVDPGPDFPWDKFLSYVNGSTSAASGIPSIFTNTAAASAAAPQPQEDDVFVLSQKTRGTWLIGAGFAHHFDPEAWGTYQEQLVATGVVKQHELDPGPVGVRQFDLIRAAHTQPTA